MGSIKNFKKFKGYLSKRPKCVRCRIYFGKKQLIGNGKWIYSTICRRCWNKLLLTPPAEDIFGLKNLPKSEFKNQYKIRMIRYGNDKLLQK